MNREKVKQLTGKKVAERKQNKGQGRVPGWCRNARADYVRTMRWT